MKTADIIGYTGIIIFFIGFLWFAISIMILQNKSMKRLKEMRIK